MAFTPVERMQIKNVIERVLHVPGNYSGGTLEMAMVFDCNLPKEFSRQMGKDIATLLKSHSEVFRNVRLNGIRWEEDEVFIKELTSLPLLQMGRYFDTYECVERRKKLELLMEQLKKFYARSKVILLFTDGNYVIENDEIYKANMHPFLYRKLIVIQCCNQSGLQKEVASADTGEEGMEDVVPWKLELHTGTELLKMSGTNI